MKKILCLAVFLISGCSTTKDMLLFVDEVGLSRSIEGLNKVGKVVVRVDTLTKGVCYVEYGDTSIVNCYHVKYR